MFWVISSLSVPQRLHMFSASIPIELHFLLEGKEPISIQFENDINQNCI